jgi:hypothetical protein
MSDIDVADVSSSQNGGPHRASVVYESVFGATREVAEAIGRGLRVDGRHADTVRGGPSGDDLVGGVDLLVIGAPTHARTLPSPASRHEALEWPHRPGRRRELERHAAAPGVREWLAATSLRGIPVAVFVTRSDTMRLLTGSAASRLAAAATKAGGCVMVPPQEFSVDRDGGLVEGELDRAQEWGRSLAELMPSLVASGGGAC